MPKRDKTLIEFGHQSLFQNWEVARLLRGPGDFVLVNEIANPAQNAKTGAVLA